MTSVDVLLVGQGLAGSVLLRRLQQAGKNVIVFDKNEAHSSSKIAGGLVNPITGRRFVKSWMFEELNLVARPFYEAWQAEINEQLLYEMPIVRGIEDRRFVDDIEAKTIEPNYKDYIEFVKPRVDSYFNPSTISYKINQGYRIDIQKLLNNTRNKLVERGYIIEESFDYDKLSVFETHVIYKEWQAEKIIFCEGRHAVHNPWFKDLPFQLTKGELFELKQEQVLDYAYKRDLILLPIAEDKLWCGALNYWEFEDDEPSEDGELILLQKLKKIYHPDPYIHRHLAAIRPTTRDRRPLLGTHREHTALSIFNGLGAKGTILAPYFSQLMMEHLYEQKELPSEVEISRATRPKAKKKG